MIIFIFLPSSDVDIYVWYVKAPVHKPCNEVVCVCGKLKNTNLSQYVGFKSCSILCVEILDEPDLLRWLQLQESLQGVTMGIFF
jgi:hypothetical protein